MRNAPAVTLAREAGVATITLNAPERLNAIDTPMGRLLDQAFVDAASDPDVRVLLVTGAGRGFCAGASMARLEQFRAETYDPPASEDDVFAALDGAPAAFRSRYTVPLAIPKPVIAAVNGPCAGAGLVLALACDIRLAASSARFVASFAARGLVAEGGSACLLSRIVGRGVAADMLMSARSVTAEEAARTGLVSAVQPDEAFRAFASDYAHAVACSVSPASLRFIKAQLLQDLGHALPAALEMASEGVHATRTSPDFAEGIQAFLEKREPRFAPLTPQRG